MTIPDTDWLKNNMGWNSPWSSAYTAIKLNNYYDILCSIIYENFYLHPTDDQIEEYIANGTYTHTDTLDNKTVVTCKITTAEKRISLFKKAFAAQLIYDCENGRMASIGESETYAPDTVNCLKRLGLWQRTVFTI